MHLVVIIVEIKNQALINIPAKWKVITDVENESLSGIWCSANEYSTTQCWVIEWKNNATRFSGVIKIVIQERFVQFFHSDI